MIYISRYIGRANYGVVDTDDDVEEEVGVAELTEATKYLGTVIKGADSVRRGGPLWLFIEKIRPYQPPDTLTQLQVKTSLLKHIDVLTYKSMVTSVFVHSEEITTPVTVRLSDFGSVCADGLFRGLNWTGRHTVTFVFDDNLSFMEYSFDLPVDDSSHSLGVDGAGIMFDLRDVNNSDLYRTVYSAVWDRNDIEVERSILDRPERKAHMMKEMSTWVRVF